MLSPFLSHVPTLFEGDVKSFLRHYALGNSKVYAGSHNHTAVAVSSLCLVATSAPASLQDIAIARLYSLCLVHRLNRGPLLAFTLLPAGMTDLSGPLFQTPHVVVAAGDWSRLACLSACSHACHDQLHVHT